MINASVSLLLPRLDLFHPPPAFHPIFQVKCLICLPHPETSKYNMLPRWDFLNFIELFHLSSVIFITIFLFPLGSSSSSLLPPLSFPRQQQQQQQQQQQRGPVAATCGPFRNSSSHGATLVKAALASPPLRFPHYPSIAQPFPSSLLNLLSVPFSLSSLSHSLPFPPPQFNFNSVLFFHYSHVN